MSKRVCLNPGLLVGNFLAQVPWGRAALRGITLRETHAGLVTPGPLVQYDDHEMREWECLKQLEWLVCDW